MQAVEGMKLVCHELSQATNDVESTTMDDIVRDSDCHVMFGLSVYKCFFIFFMHAKNLIINFCDYFVGS